MSTVQATVTVDRWRRIIVPAQLWAEAGITKAIGLIACGLSKRQGVFGPWNALDRRRYRLIIGCTINKDGRVVVPRDVTRRFGVRPGAEIAVQLQKPHLILRPATAKQATSV